MPHLARRLISTCQHLDLRQKAVELGTAVELAIGDDGTDLLGVANRRSTVTVRVPSWVRNTLVT